MADASAYIKQTLADYDFMCLLDRGNKNNFLTMDECEKFCHGVYDAPVAAGEFCFKRWIRSFKPEVFK
jgi:hypothetical protein